MFGRSTVGSAERGSRRVLTISKDRDVFTGIILIEVSPDKLRRVLDVVMHHTEETIKHMPGFVGYAFLESLDGERVTEYVQWESPDHIQAAFKDPRFSEHLTDVRKIANEEFFPCEIYYVNEAGHQAGEGTATISKEAGSLTAITEFAVGPGKQQALLDLIVDDHESSLRDFPGFLSKGVFRSLDGGKVFEHLQLESREVFEALGQSPELRAHQERVSGLARPKTRLHEVDYVSVAEAAG